MRSFLSILAILISIAAMGQVNKVATAKLSPLTKRYLYKLENSKAKTIPGYVYYKKPGGQVYVSALIKVSDTAVAQSGLAGIGSLVGTKAGKIWTVKVPVKNVAAFTRLPGISYIQLDMPLAPQPDAASKATNTNSAR